MGILTENGCTNYIINLIKVLVMKLFVVSLDYLMVKGYQNSFFSIIKVIFQHPLTLNKLKNTLKYL